MDWGESYPEADYPRRQAQKISLFDLKKFVTEKKGKMMMNNQPGMPAGFRRDEMPMNPFAINPNMQMMNNRPMPNNPMKMGPNPFVNSLKDIDIDEMIRDIDKKLQELDEEEKREKEKLKNENRELMNNTKVNNNDLSSLIEKITSNPVENTKVVENKVEEKPTQIINKVEEPAQIISKEEPVQIVNKDEKPKINIDVDSVIVNENVITDDEFFDDFFYDDDDE